MNPTEQKQQSEIVRKQKHKQGTTALDFYMELKVVTSITQDENAKEIYIKQISQY